MGYTFTDADRAKALERRKARPEQVSRALAERAAGASLHEAGKAAGLSHAAVSLYEHGARPLSVAAATGELLHETKGELAGLLRKMAVGSLEELLGDEGARLKSAPTQVLGILAGIGTQRLLEVLASMGGGSAAQRGGLSDASSSPDLARVLAPLLAQMGAALVGAGAAAALSGRAAVAPEPDAIEAEVVASEPEPASQ